MVIWLMTQQNVTHSLHRRGFCSMAYNVQLGLCLPHYMVTPFKFLCVLCKLLQYWVSIWFCSVSCEGSFFFLNLFCLYVCLSVRLCLCMSMQDRHIYKNVLRCLTRVSDLLELKSEVIVCFPAPISGGELHPSLNTQQLPKIKKKIMTSILFCAPVIYKINVIILTS